MGEGRNGAPYGGGHTVLEDKNDRSINTVEVRYQSVRYLSQFG